MFKVLSKNKFNNNEIYLFLLCNPIFLFFYSFGIKVKVGTEPIRPFFSLYVFFSISIIVIYFLKNIKNNIGFKIKINFLFFYVFYFLFLLVFSFLFSSSYRDLISSFYEIANVIIPLSIAYLSRNNPFYVINSLFYLSIINIFYTFFQFLGILPAFSSFLSVGSLNPIFYRFSGLFTNSVNSSFIFAFFIIIFIYYRELIPKFFSNKVFLIIYFIAYLFCFSRASIIFLFFCFIVKEITRTRRNLSNLSFISISLGVSIWLINSPFTRLGSIFSLARATDDINPFDPYDIDAPRLLRLEHFFNTILDNIPLIGPYNNEFLTFSFFPDTLQRFGIVFGLIFYFFIAFVLMQSLKNIKKLITLFSIGIFATFQLTNGILNAQFFLPTFFFYILTGWILLETKINRSLDKS